MCKDDICEYFFEEAIEKLFSLLDEFWDAKFALWSLFEVRVKWCWNKIGLFSLIIGRVLEK